MNYDVKLVPVKALKPSPKTLALHKAFDPTGADAWLVESIRTKGIIEPIKAYKTGVVEDGWRRSQCAKHLEMQRVPAVILEDGIEIFEDMQLGRQLSPYAVCKLKRIHIEELVAYGEENRLRGLNNVVAVSTQSRNVDQEWAKLTQAYRMKKETLQRGVKLLARIDELRATDPDRATAADSTFRERGVYPTEDLFRLWNGEPESTDGADDARDDAEPDARDIDYEIKEKLPPKQKRPAKQTEPPAADEGDEPTPVSADKMPGALNVRDEADKDLLTTLMNSPNEETREQAIKLQAMRVAIIESIKGPRDVRLLNMQARFDALLETAFEFDCISREATTT